ncbi:MAG: hypothetical protein M3024_01365 [Candidatus Dormibacteraeota bacterium]|nr:hypothetical protein [Candidatus Dormibacteraeota bacterium]
MARSSVPAYVDVANPALAIDCPNCGLLTARFNQYCRNCGYSLWPSGPFASAAFQAWRGAEPEREQARRFDIELAPAPATNVIDFEARAHHLGIHIFPSSSWPFIICVGFFFMALAAVPFPTPTRIALGIIGLLAFLIGVVGWVVLEDTRMYPGPDVLSHGGGHGAGESDADEDAR